MEGPFHLSYRASYHIRWVGIILKPLLPGKYRLIVDLSSPKYYSVNTVTDADWCSLTYAKVRPVQQHLSKSWTKSLLWQTWNSSQLAEIFQYAPKINHFWQWSERLYLHVILPFGLCSAPKMFNTVADMVLWTMHARACHTLFTSFVIICYWQHGSDSCQPLLEIALHTRHKLGMPGVAYKTEVSWLPSHSLVFK